jgi:hypothetical protein
MHDSYWFWLIIFKIEVFDGYTIYPFIGIFLAVAEKKNSEERKLGRENDYNLAKNILIALRFCPQITYNMFNRGTL